jgi:hypothetical protein
MVKNWIIFLIEVIFSVT